ncbi:MAG: translation initiation factor eIF-1A [Promethearchaeota archaeon]
MTPGKKSNLEDNVATRRVRLPDKEAGEMFAIVIEIYGGDRMLIKCEDGKNRIGTIRGKIRKRMWCRIGDLILCVPYDWETKVEGRLEKALIVWRYTSAQVNWLRNKGYLNENLDINNI